MRKNRHNFPAMTLLAAKKLAAKAAAKLCQIEFNRPADGRLIATGPDGSLETAPGLFIFAAGGQFSPEPNPKSGKLL
jgi:hypothetical protein